jgi:hypothetical protein
MRTLLRALLVWAALLPGWTEEEAAKTGREFILPTSFEFGHIRLTSTSDIRLERKVGVDCIVYSVRPAVDSPTWSFSLYAGDFPQALEPKPDGRREWYPFNLLNWLQLHKQSDGGLFAEAYVPVGHEMDIDDKTGTFKWVRGEQKIHIGFSMQRESEFEKVLSSLKLTWEPFPKP